MKLPNLKFISIDDWSGWIVQWFYYILFTTYISLATVNNFPVQFRNLMHLSINVSDIQIYSFWLQQKLRKSPAFQFWVLPCVKLQFSLITYSFFFYLPFFMMEHTCSNLQIYRCMYSLISCVFSKKISYSLLLLISLFYLFFLVVY